MTHEEIKNSIAAYSLGALDDNEFVEVGQHLEHGCPECESLLQELQDVSGALAFSAPPQTPPPALKEKILKAVVPSQESKPVSKSSREKGVAIRGAEMLEEARRRWMRVSWGLAFAVILVAVGFGIYTLSLHDRIDRLNSRIDISDQLVQDLQTRLAEKEEIIRTVQSPQIRIVDLKGLDAAPAAEGKVLWNPEQNRAVFLAFNLPDPPTDKDYQLWMLRGNQPIDAGLLQFEEEGGVVRVLDTIADDENLSAFAVTLEPKGGVPQPTGDMYLLGAVKS